MDSKQIGSLVVMGLALLYDVSPVDIIPDIPVVGWVDDFFITATAGLNVIQQSTRESAAWLSTIAKGLKWMLIVIGVIAILLLVLCTAFIVSLFNK